MLANSDTFHRIEEVLESKGYVDVEATGYTMLPVIHEGDQCRFVPVRKGDLVKGDIVLYINERGEIMGQRFFGWMEDGERAWIKGDACLSYDTPVHKNQIIGKLLFIQRQDQLIEPTDFRMQAWRFLVVYVPQVTPLLKHWADKQKQDPAVIPFKRK